MDRWTDRECTLQTLCVQTVVMGWNASSWQHTHMKICSILRRKFFQVLQQRRDKRESVLCLLCMLLCCDFKWAVAHNL